MAIVLVGLRRCHRHFYGRLRRSAYRDPRVSQQQLLLSDREFRGESSKAKRGLAGATILTGLGLGDPADRGEAN